ncbi:tumor necrosis factor receptor superfamily member 1B isoform X2 [Platichthys flesus]|uniref:tumor necrosis factor receptor superfamily member 1B isoform X2 n=1 Tax=Platichthys flesus TaxID=8260 RepID=UPI002DBE95B6|nr:tumor necrosis factor receptor superfamily member 1B isoform X2 [Platichthys flesus]
MDRTQMEGVATRQQSTWLIIDAARNAPLDSDCLRNALTPLRLCVNNVTQTSTWRNGTTQKTAHPVADANQIKVCNMSKTAPQPHGPGVCASLGCTASWNLMTLTVQNVECTVHVKLVMECLWQAYSDVKCERCPTGMFSDTRSLTDPCRPHTDCHGKAVVKQGNTSSNTLCEEGVVNPKLPQDTTKGYQPGTLFSTAGTIRSTVLAISDPTLSVSATVSNEVFNHSTTSQQPYKPPGISLAAVISGVIGILLLFIIIILVFLCKAVRCKDAEKFYPKVDANGNCESEKQITESYLEETQLMCFKVTCPEQQSLLDKAGACSDYSQSSNCTYTLTGTDGGGSHDSINPLQSTLALNNSYPAVSEPLTLMSNTEPVTPQPSVPSESSSQPTSPQIISPLTANPQFNVNITFHIGNGSCGTTSVIPTHLTESDSHLPYGEEEESFSIPQQEDGKHSLRPVQVNVCE